MSRLSRAVLVSVLALGGGVVPLGCGASEREAEETIEGKSPADYREEMDQNIAQPLPDTAPSPSR